MRVRQFKFLVDDGDDADDGAGLLELPKFSDRQWCRLLNNTCFAVGVEGLPLACGDDQLEAAFFARGGGRVRAATPAATLVPAAAAAARAKATEEEATSQAPSQVDTAGDGGDGATSGREESAVDGEHRERGETEPEVGSSEGHEEAIAEREEREKRNRRRGRSP